MSEARMCRIFHCDLRHDRFCCADCPKQFRCSNPCENHPSRCGLEDKGGRVRPTEVRPVHAKDLWAKDG